jgi:hypothetical protein
MIVSFKCPFCEKDRMEMTKMQWDPCDKLYTYRYECDNPKCYTFLETAHIERFLKISLTFMDLEIEEKQM